MTSHRIQNIAQPQFASLHPLLTPHYQLDWLTQFKLPEIAALVPKCQGATIDEISQFINHTMQQIMKNELLCWGISTHHNDQLVGIITIPNLTPPSVSVQIVVAKSLSNSLQEAELRHRIAKLLQRMQRQIGQWQVQ